MKRKKKECALPLNLPCSNSYNVCKLVCVHRAQLVMRANNKKVTFVGFYIFDTKAEANDETTASAAAGFPEDLSFH